MRTITQRELRNDSGQVLRDLAAGEDMLVTVSGEPIGVLHMSPPPTPRRRFLTPQEHREKVLAGPALSPQEQKAWLEDIRAADGDERDPWARESGRAR